MAQGGEAIIRKEVFTRAIFFTGFAAQVNEEILFFHPVSARSRGSVKAADQAAFLSVKWIAAPSFGCPKTRSVAQMVPP